MGATAALARLQVLCGDVRCCGGTHLGACSNVAVEVVEAVEGFETGVELGMESRIALGNMCLMWSPEKKRFAVDGNFAKLERLNSCPGV